MSHLDEWQMFSNRYGHATWDGAPLWASRHATGSDPTGRSCACPGPSGSGHGCGQSCTQEDLLCDECRQWCYAMDAAGNYHQFATLRSR